MWLTCPTFIEIGDDVQANIADIAASADDAVIGAKPCWACREMPPPRRECSRFRRPGDDWPYLRGTPKTFHSISAVIAAKSAGANTVAMARIILPRLKTAQTYRLPRSV